MTRKIVQVAPVYVKGRDDRAVYLYALCDDGTLWVREPGAWDELWRPVSFEAPQDDQ